MTTYPNELLYTKEHEWLKEDSGVFTLGITNYATEQLGDIVHIELPETGKELEAGDSVGEVESVKSVSEIYLPVTGKVIEVNEALLNNPALINDDAYGDGWIVKIEVENKNDAESLMSSEAYQAFLAEET